MFVEKIEFARKNLTDGGRAVTAVVTFRAKGQTKSFECSARLPQPSNENVQKAALLADALRQIAHLPGYLTGQRNLRFSPAALQA